MSTEPPCRGVIINKLESHLNKPKTQTEIVYPQVIQGSGHRQIQMVSKKVIKKYKATDSELGGIVNYPRSIDTVQIAL